MKKLTAGSIFYLLGIVGLAFVSSYSVAQEGNRPVDQANKQLAASGNESQPNTTAKIVDGTDAPAGKFPFQVALISSGTPENQESFGQFCGGSLIDSEWIMTAAHCVPNTLPSEVDVYIGSNILPTGEPGTGIRRSLQRIQSHPDYDSGSKDNDIALLKLSSAAPEIFQPVTPANAELDERYNFDNGDVVVIGWGRTSEGGSSTPSLQRVWVDIQNTQQCEANYQVLVPSIQITSNMFCAGLVGGGRDSCQGDSGGFIGSPMGNSEYVQLGVVSWGFGCARENLYGVYTRVGVYTDWITEIKDNF